MYTKCAYLLTLFSIWLLLKVISSILKNRRPERVPEFESLRFRHSEQRGINQLSPLLFSIDNKNSIMSSFLYQIHFLYLLEHKK